MATNLQLYILESEEKSELAVRADESLNVRMKTPLPPTAVESSQDSVGCNQCHLCNSRFVQLRSLTAHIKSVHEGNHSNEDVCTECAITFYSKHNMERHMQTMHKRDVLFPCCNCPLVFYRNDHLVRHNNTCKPKVLPRSETRTSNKCAQEEQRILAQLEVQIESLRTRSTIPLPFTSEMPISIYQFWCPLCTVNYTSKQNVRRHIIAIHVDDKPFQCSSCPLKFNFNAQLETHIGNYHSPLSEIEFCPC